jgi:hypothetical protein
MTPGVGSNNSTWLVYYFADRFGWSVDQTLGMEQRELDKLLIVMDEVNRIIQARNDQ